MPAVMAGVQVDPVREIVHALRGRRITDPNDIRECLALLARLLKSGLLEDALEIVKK